MALINFTFLLVRNNWLLRRWDPSSCVEPRRFATHPCHGYVQTLLPFNQGNSNVPCTGEGKLIVMTPSFDVLHESMLYTNEFGEGKETSFPSLVDS
jgi:hypothetical protein